MKPETPAWVGITYCIYAVSMLAIMFGGVGYAVFVLDHSGWWFALAFVVCACGWSPWRWHSIWTGVEVPYSKFSQSK